MLCSKETFTREFGLSILDSPASSIAVKISVDTLWLEEILIHQTSG